MRENQLVIRFCQKSIFQPELHQKRPGKSGLHE